MQWIKEEEFVVDELRSSSSIRGISMPNFEVFDARIVSALNKIIHNSQFKRRISLEEQKAQRETVSLEVDRLPTWSTNNSGSLEPMILSKTTPTYSLSVYEMTIFRNSIQSGTEFIFFDENPAWWHLGRIVQIMNTRVWKIKTVLELYDLPSHQKEGSDYHRLKTMVKRSIEQEIRKNNFWARSGNYERNAVVFQNQEHKKFGQRILGDCWQWETNGQCVTGDNCSFRYDMNKRWKLHSCIRLWILSCGRMSETHRGPEVPEGKVPAVECRDGLARIDLEELAITHFVKNGTLQNACSTRPRVFVCLMKSANSQIVRLMNSRQEGLKRMMAKVLWLGWKREIGKKENLLQTNVTNDRGNLGREVIRSLDKIHLKVNHLKHGNWVAYFRTWRRRSLFSGRAPTCRSQSDVWNSQRLLHVIPKFETKIFCSEKIAQVNFMSVAPTLQNLRTGLRRRQSGKSKVPAK